MDIIKYIKENISRFDETGDSNDEGEYSLESSQDEDIFIKNFKYTPTHVIERVFANMTQSRRVGFITDREFPHDVWIDFYQLVNNDDEKYEEWGLETFPIAISETQTTCKDHDDPLPVVERKIKKNESDQSDYAAGYSSTITGEVGADAKIVNATSGSSVTESSQMKNSLTESTGGEIYFYECSTNSSECRLNRHTFIRIGDECMVIGQDRYKALNSIFLRKSSIHLKQPKKVIFK